jgi:hypothetical protein
MTIYDYTSAPYQATTLNSGDKIVVYLENPTVYGAVWNVTPAQTTTNVSTAILYMSSIVNEKITIRPNFIQNEGNYIFILNGNTNFEGKAQLGAATNNVVNADHPNITGTGNYFVAKFNGTTFEWTKEQINPVCLRAGTPVLTFKNNGYNEVPIETIVEGDYVIDINNNIVKVTNNFVTLNAKVFYLFEKDCFGSVPTKDIYITHNHGFRANGKYYLSHTCDKRKEIVLNNPEKVYTLETENGIPVNMCGLFVDAWKENTFVDAAKDYAKIFYKNTK